MPVLNHAAAAISLAGALWWLGVRVNGATPRCISQIDRLKITANKDNREARINSMLELMAAPKKWELSDGEISEVHTPFTTRSKELMDLYNGLKEKVSTLRTLAFRWCHHRASASAMMHARIRA